jgi:hypothetical protein
MLDIPKFSEQQAKKTKHAEGSKASYVKYSFFVLAKAKSTLI